MKKESRTRAMQTIGSVVFKTAPKQAGLAAALWTISALSQPVFAIVLGKLVQAAASGNDQSNIVTLALILALTCGMGQVLDEIAYKVMHAVSEKTAHELDRRMLNMVMSVPGVEHHERTEYLDKLERLRNEHWLLSESVPMVLATTTFCVQVVSTIVVLAAIDFRLLLLAAFAIPPTMASRKSEKRRVEKMEHLQSEWRKSDDALELITEAAPAKEVRLFGLGEELIRRHSISSRNSYLGEYHARRHGAPAIAGSRFLFVLSFLGGILLVSRQVIAGDLSTAQLITAIALATTLMAQAANVARQITFLDWCLAAVHRYSWLMEYGEARSNSATGVSPTRLEKGIHLNHVAFSYPDTDTVVLEDVDVLLPAGKTIALIGDNGAGKSTLIKLLTGMYSPTSGSIDIDGTPLSEIDPQSWRSNTAAAFQDHAKFEFVASQTVGVGDPLNLDTEEIINLAVERGGAKAVVSDLPENIRTQLGAQWSGGVDLSGGQWQKLSLARGMMRDPMLLVLDEPTSALDAETEHALFEQFAKAARARSSDEGTVTLLVSHRFSTVKMADLIVVLSAGKVVEVGSHDELIAKNGTYAELYELQARAYR